MDEGGFIILFASKIHSSLNRVVTREVDSRGGAWRRVAACRLPPYSYRTQGEGHTACGGSECTSLVAGSTRRSSGVETKVH